MPISKGRNKKKKKEIRKKEESYYAPNSELNIPILSKILYEIWPKDEFNTITGIEECKRFYNASFKKIEIELLKILDLFHPAAWARISYLQLEAWTLLWIKSQFKNFDIKIIGPKTFIPSGRYGWRYILEKSLEESEKSTKKNLYRPSDKNINDVFTLVSALAQCAEISNYLHYLPQNFSSIEVNFGLNTYLTPPKLNLAEDSKFKKIRNILGSEPDEKIYPELSPENNEVLMDKINRFLETHFEITYEEILFFSNVVLPKINRMIKASVILDSFSNMVALCRLISNYSENKVYNIFKLILLDVKDPAYTKRDFLMKSQQKRMINHCGAIIYLDNQLEVMYSKEASQFLNIKDESKHIIIAPMLMAEWLNNFTTRLIFGQRNDLKRISEKANRDISDIEEYYHKQIFEKCVITLLERKKFHCLNLKRINKKDIECGEIDILAYNKEINVFLIIESKSLVTSRDAKSMGQIISDHFKQKKYDEKFLKKIKWANENLNIITEIFENEFSFKFSQKISIEPYFVTRSSNILMFIPTKYKIISFSDFDNLLRTKYAN